MKISRTELREKIMVILYQIDFYDKEKMPYEIEKVIKDNTEIENEFIKDIVYGVIEHKKELDEKINKYLKEWTLDRLGNTDKAILRMSVYELLYYDTPHIVSINEGINLSKKYSDEKVVKVINAVLDNILNNEVKDE